jgi:hypothetical protein
VVPGIIDIPKGVTELTRIDEVGAGKLLGLPARLLEGAFRSGILGDKYRRLSATACCAIAGLNEKLMRPQPLLLGNYNTGIQRRVNGQRETCAPARIQGF